MKVLVFSDSHGAVSDMLRITDKEKPDIIVHLGDHASDISELHAQNPKLKLICVCGNCDPKSAAPETLTVEQGSFKIFITHGHIYHVKYRLDLVQNAAIANGADILLFGHTHKPLYKIFGNLHILNPGSVSGTRTFRKTYGLIEFSDNDFNCKIKDCS